MQIYILRHGIAEDGRPGGNDADRALTTEGKRKLREVLRVAAKAGTQPALMISSTYVRAVETARVAAEELGYQSEFLRTEALVPGSDPESVWEEIRAHKGSESVMIVGHEPLLSRLIGFLLNAPSIYIDMKKAAIVRVDMEEFGAQPRGVLKWMLTPKLAAV